MGDPQRLLEDDDLGGVTDRPSKTLISRDQPAIEGFGQRDVRGVVGAEVVAKAEGPYAKSVIGVPSM